jgi:aminomethyltransferase
MSKLHRTVFYEQHVALGAKIVEFAGWEMPIFYPTGIVKEHLATRKGAGLFDVSHMGRFTVGGAGALKFLQHVLTNSAEALDIRETGAQYTMIPNEAGGAVDDAYLYRFVEEEYLLVVNGANREKDWDHFQSLLKDFDDVELTDRTKEIAMLAFQGPLSRHVMEDIVESGPCETP